MRSVGPKIVTDGLVLYLDAGNKKSYPGSGSNWYDLTANKNDGTLTGPPVFSAANRGDMIFDGTSDYIAFSSGVVDSSYTGLTVEVWLNFAQNFNETFIINSDGVIHSFYIDSSLTELGFLVSSSTDSSLRRCSVTHSINTWHQFVGVWSAGASSDVYLDGILKNGTLFETGTVNSLRNGNANLTLGSYQSGKSPTYFPGSIPVFRIYNRALSAVEIKQNYAAIKSRFGY